LASTTSGEDFWGGPGGHVLGDILEPELEVGILGIQILNLVVQTVDLSVVVVYRFLLSNKHIFNGLKGGL
jgi:hypothetical protein